MKRSFVARDILDIIRACMGDDCQDYVFARTRGVPPADCNSVSLSWIDRDVSQFQDCESLDQSCQAMWTGVYGLRITLTRICIGPDQGEKFDWIREDGEAACFDDAVELIEQCLLCSDFSQLGIDHQIDSIQYDSTMYDVESDGGGFSAYIEVTIRAAECCP